MSRSISRQDERRRSPRHELLASIELRSADEVLLLSVQNLSITGALIAADGHDLSQFATGGSYRVAIFDPENERYQVDVTGRVVRLQTDALALTWDDEAALFQMQSLIERLQPG